jgi:plastocyanin
MCALFIRNIKLSVLFLVAILALETTNLSAPAWAADATVTIDNFTFEPQRLTVKAGTTVTWVNQDDIPHALASTTKVFKSKALDTTTNSRSRSRHRAGTTTSARCILI